jgi:hypothetical protein
MLGLVQIISTTIDKLKRRVPKFTYRGPKDVQTAYQIGPHGVDSVPIKDMIAVYGDTNADGSTVILGYINKNALAKEGEMRIFATDANGGLKGYVWLKNTGICEIMGSTDNAVRWLALNTQLQALVTAQNVENTKIATAISALIPGLYVPAPLVLDITSAKITEIKTT